jgi:hypothetical protein
MSFIANGADRHHPLTPNRCWDGHPLAAAEHRRQMRMATAALDELLRDGEDEHDSPRRGAAADTCRGQFTAGGKWVPCCSDGAA